jgi:hypothetical protein
MEHEERGIFTSRGYALKLVPILFIIYLLGLALFRLYFSPIARFPGPKLAALTRWYEFYYEVVLRGKFSDHITELHKTYGELNILTATYFGSTRLTVLEGPIIRITPDELHVNDPAFYDILFNKNPKSVKNPWFNPRFGNESGVFSTCDAAHHKLRRGALNP